MWKHSLEKFIRKDKNIEIYPNIKSTKCHSKCYLSTYSFVKKAMIRHKITM